MVRNIVTKDEEKSEVLNKAFFASVSPTPELEDRDRQQNQVPIIHGEMVSDLIHSLWGQMGSLRAKFISLCVLEELP